MTRLEFDRFVESDLRPRWPRWDPADAVLDDWFAILRYHTPEVARDAVQQHRLDEKSNQFEPKAGAVQRILRRSGRRGREVPTELVPAVLCLEPPAGHPGWAGREWVRLEHRFSGDAASHQHMMEAASRSAEDIQRAEGGRWCGVVRPAGQLPEGMERLWGDAARKQIERVILDGPDGPGRRFLRRMRSEGAGRTMREVVAASLAAPDPHMCGLRGQTPSEGIVAGSKVDRPAESRTGPLMADEEFFASNPVEEDDHWEAG